MKSKLTEDVSFKASKTLVGKLNEYAELYNEPQERVVRALLTLGLGVYFQDSKALPGMLAALDSLDDM